MATKSETERDSRFHFQNAVTINDENEFKIPLIPAYLTMQETGIIFMTVPIGYIGGSILFDNNLVAIGMGFLCFFSAAMWIKKYRHGKPSSYLWDMRLAIPGLLEPKRGLIKVFGKPTPLASIHRPRPSIFLAGKKKPSQDLSISEYWQLSCPPTILPKHILIRRQRRSLEWAPTDARGLLEHATMGERGRGGGVKIIDAVANPTIPVRLTMKPVEYLIPPSVRQLVDADLVELRSEIKKNTG